MDEKHLYELIGRLFAEGHDMQALIRQLQTSSKTSQETIEKLKEDIYRLTQQLNQARAEIESLKKKDSDGQESSRVSSK